MFALYKVQYISYLIIVVFWKETKKEVAGSGYPPTNDPMGNKEDPAENTDTLKCYICMLVWRTVSKIEMHTPGLRCL